MIFKKTSPGQANAAKAVLHQKISGLLKTIRLYKKRNSELAEQLKARVNEQNEASDLYKRNRLFNEVLRFDAPQQIALALMLKQTGFGDPAPTAPPPRTVPPELIAEYSMDGKIPIKDSWYDFTYPANYPLIYTDPEIDYFFRRFAENGTYMYGGLDHVIRRCFKAYPVRGLRVVNIGSLSPWFEATLLHHGAEPTTLDYNTIVTHTSRIRTLAVPDTDFSTLQFDAALSISSYEHDGLGAYGDPLDPDGDLKAMQTLKQIVKPGGLLFLNISVGAERLEWNLARIYGKHRLPQFLKGWTWIDTFAFEESFWDGTQDGEPLFVMRNNG